MLAAAVAADTDDTAHFVDCSHGKIDYAHNHVHVAIVDDDVRVSVAASRDPLVDKPRFWTTSREVLSNGCDRFDSTLDSVRCIPRASRAGPKVDEICLALDVLEFSTAPSVDRRETARL